MSSNESDPSSQPLLPLDHKPITEIEIGAATGRASKTRISKGGAAIRSTARPGMKSEPESSTPRESKGSGNFTTPEPIAPSPAVQTGTVPVIEPVTEAQAQDSRTYKPFERKPNTKVFVPFGGALEEETKSGPSAGIVLFVLALLALGGWGYFHFSGGANKKITVGVEVSKKDQDEPVAAPAPNQAASPSEVEQVQAAPEASPVGSPAIVATPSPEVSSTAGSIASVPEQAALPTPEPAKPKIRVEPLHIPEESSPLLKAAAKVPLLIARAQSGLEESEKAHQLRLQAQDKADAAVKEAQAAAEKANAELLLKQAEAGEAAKAVADAASASGEKKRAIQQAQAEMARFQAVASQINWLKQERAMETDSPTSDTKIADPAIDPADVIEALPESPAESGTNSAAAPSTPTAFVGEKEMVNSLGMKFVLVGDVRFSVWLTRVQDYDAYAQAAGLKGTAWKQPGFAQTPNDPVVNVNWKDANAFCRWLTAKEHKEGVLPNDLVYRLPTDAEWSLAAGLPYEKGRSAQLRDKDVPGIYPWGNQWPPNPGAGNFTGEEAAGSGATLKGYNDGYAWTSPVGSFLANQQGLYDMGGNASQWCQDWWNEEKNARVIRGSSWANSASEEALLSSARLHAAPESASNSCGFRCVISAEGYQ